MRNCLVCLLLVLLLAANGYAIWQIRCLRNDVVRLQQRGQVSGARESESLLDTAQAALEAVRRGRFHQAGEELDRLAREMERAQVGATQREADLQRQIVRAQQDLARKHEEAAARIERIVHELSHKGSSGEAGG